MAVLYLYMRYRYNWNEVTFSMFSTFGMITNLIGKKNHVRTSRVNNSCEKKEKRNLRERS